MNAIYISGEESVDELQSLREASQRLVLTRDALSMFVSRFLNAELSPSQLEQVGNLLEGEPVDYDDDTNERLIAQVLFEMSTPAANGPIDQSAAHRWRVMLEPK